MLRIEAHPQSYCTLRVVQVCPPLVDEKALSTGLTTKFIFAGSERVAMKSSDGSFYYFHTDQLGSSSAVTDPSGNSVENLAYQPYGATQAKTGTVDVHHKYTSQELDDSTGLYFYGARYYDPALGRFISADTVIQTIRNPQSLNRYSYASNNPMRYIDPTGHLDLGAPDLTCNICDSGWDPSWDWSSNLSEDWYSSGGGGIDLGGALSYNSDILNSGNSYSNISSNINSGFSNLNNAQLGYVNTNIPSSSIGTVSNLQLGDITGLGSGNNIRNRNVRLTDEELSQIDFPGLIISSGNAIATGIEIGTGAVMVVAGLALEVPSISSSTLLIAGGSFFVAHGIINLPFVEEEYLKSFGVLPPGPSMEVDMLGRNGAIANESVGLLSGTKDLIMGPETIDRLSGGLDAISSGKAIYDIEVDETPQNTSTPNQVP